MGLCGSKMAAKERERKLRMEQCRVQAKTRENIHYGQTQIVKKKWKRLQTRLSTRRILAKSMVRSESKILRVSTREKAEEGDEFKVARHGNSVDPKQAAALTALNDLFTAGNLTADDFNKKKHEIIVLHSEGRGEHA